MRQEEHNSDNENPSVWEKDKGINWEYYSFQPVYDEDSVKL